MVLKVELHGQESKNYKVHSRSQKEFFKVKEGVAKHLGREASSLRFFLEKEGLLRRLTGKERAIDLEGASMVVKDFEEASAHNDVVTSPGYEDPIIRIAKEVPFVQIL